MSKKINGEMIRFLFSLGSNQPFIIQEIQNYHF